jgi:hypothetical protein
MPRRHIRTYRRPKPIDDADVERILSAEREPDERWLTRERPAIDYRPMIAVVGLVIIGLPLIAFLLSLRMTGNASRAGVIEAFQELSKPSPAEDHLRQTQAPVV